MAFKRKHYLITLFLIILSVLIYKTYLGPQKESNPVKLKIMTMIPEKRVIKPWTSLLDQKQNRKKEPTTSKPPLPEEAPTSELAQYLQKNLKNIDNTNLKTLQINIKFADEIIAREPDSYSAYKAKLISLLIMEGKFNQSIDDIEIENLLETMAKFDIRTEENSMNEALLISNTNNELNSAIEELNELAIQEETVTTDFEQNELLKKEDTLIGYIERLQTKINRATISEDNYINEDVVQIPFLRLMAKNEFDQVVLEAENFIERFPESSYGHFFLINALTAKGLKEESLDVLKSLPKDLQNKIHFYDENYFKEYWKRLFF